MNTLDILIRYQSAFVNGLTVTFQLAAIAWVIGLTLGAVLGAAAHSWTIAIGIPLRAAAFLLSGTPFLVLLYWAHFPFQAILGVVINPFITAAVVLTCLNTVLVAELWRGALDDFRTEYRLAGLVCGMSRIEALMHIEIPLLFRTVLPTLLALQIFILQSTLFTSLISVNEIFRVAQQIDSEVHRPIQIFTALALFFLLLCIPAYGVAFWLRGRFTRNLSDK